MFSWGWASWFFINRFPGIAILGRTSNLEIRNQRKIFCSHLILWCRIEHYISYLCIPFKYRSESILHYKSTSTQDFTFIYFSRLLYTIVQFPYYGITQRGGGVFWYISIIFPYLDFTNACRLVLCTVHDAAQVRVKSAIHTHILDCSCVLCNLSTR